MLSIWAVYGKTELCGVGIQKFRSLAKKKKSDESTLMKKWDPPTLAQNISAYIKVTTSSHGRYAPALS